MLRSPFQPLVFLLALLSLPSLCALDGLDGAARETRVAPVTDAVRKRFDLSDFYEKQILVGEFPILGSGKVSDFALLEAHYIISRMLEGRDDIVAGLVARNFRCTVMASEELTTDVPEHSDLTPASYWDRRARGLGPTRARPCVSCGEENLLQYPGDPYSTENILIHEFGHAIHAGLKRVDSTFDGRLAEAYNAAVAKGLWKDKYAGKNRDEYWAEGVQSWFGTNRENDHDHNHVNTRKELEEYDPALAALLRDVFQDNAWSYAPPRERSEKAHLTGYDRAAAPRFRWPESLQAERRRGGTARTAEKAPAARTAPSDTAKRPGPVRRDIEGWTVLVDPRLLEGPDRELGERALRSLGCQLFRISLLADEERLKKLRELEIWIELENPRLKPMQYHPSVEWLRSHGHDERLAKKVHIPHAGSLLSRHEAAKHPWCVLHELAHAYQDRFVGWNDPRLKAAYQKAVEAGSYESVLHIFGGTSRHYALSDHHEYFAEGTEAYFYRNDFYPFVRAELKEHDPALFELLRDVWGPIP